MIYAEYLFLIIIALVWIIGAVIQDLRKREVANWWNFSFVGIALAYRAFLSVYLLDYWYFVFGLIGFGIFFVLGYIFYYARAFAGGDAKLLIALGAGLALSNVFYETLEIFIYFIVLLMFCGGIYGIIYGITLSLRNREKFSKEFKRQFELHKNILYGGFAVSIIILILVFIIKEYLFVMFSLIALIFPLLYFYAKAIEESCMIKSIPARKLTVGDWLYEEIKVGRKKIKPNWEGISEDELKLLQKYKGKVLVKEGIPFTPAFLFAFIILIWIIDRGMLGWFYNLGI